jgi:hypothetical protein
VLLALHTATGGDEAPPPPPPLRIEHDLSARHPAAFYDFNVQLLTNLSEPVKLDVLVAAEDLRLKGERGWLLSRYYITPDELRGVELRVPRSAVEDEGEGRRRVRGTFRLSGVMDSRQGQISLHLLPSE